MSGEPHPYTNRPDHKPARNNKEKTETNKFTGAKKVVKNEKEGKQREKKRKREQEDRRINTARSHYACTKAGMHGKSRRKHQKTVWNGEL